MSLDTKYRPANYDDVLGQEAATTVLRQFVKEKKGFHQSYVFCGQHGSGKTTMGRILARALLCSAPKEGNPCNECQSCKVLLAGGSHECFEELDAATKSGKGDLAKIVEDVGYGSFSGKRRVYLFDECHRLSKQALDVLLKPMEDCIEGTGDKKLICIFCTTEPEKMVSTIFSRCAPAFVIRAVAPEGIATRLAYVCTQEGIEYEHEALVTIAEVTDCHIRDALKTLEGVSTLGKVTRETVSKYLHLDSNDGALLLLSALGLDLKAALEFAAQLSQELSPSVSYERLAEAALVAYKNHLGVGTVASSWNKELMGVVSGRGEVLLTFAQRFSNPPFRPTKQSLVLDAGFLHQALNCKTIVDENAFIPPKKELKNGSVKKADPSKNNSATIGGVWIDPRGIGSGPRAEVKVTKEPEPEVEGLPSDTFRATFNYHLQRLTRAGNKGNQR